MEGIYLDNNATTLVLPQVREAMLRAMEAGPTNPSSSQSSGDAGRAALRGSRHALADLLGCDPTQVHFTSGGTEANNWVLHAVAASHGYQDCRIVTSQIEHSSVLRTCEVLEDRGVQVEYLPVDSAGCVEIDALRQALSRAPVLVSVQWVNNETGVIQPVADIVAECNRQGVPVHTDAAQAVGKLPIRMSSLGIDYLTLTAHKWHGPAGVGALFVQEPRRFGSFLSGGGQESGLRPGTENIVGIAGMGLAAGLRAARLQQLTAHMRHLRDEFEVGLRSLIPGLRVNGDMADRVCNTSNVLFPHVDGQALMAQLDLRNVYCSQGSACESMRPEPSHVLRAMGLSEQDAYASLRFSVSEMNTVEEIARAIAAISGAYGAVLGSQAFSARHRQGA